MLRAPSSLHCCLSCRDLRTPGAGHGVFLSFVGFARSLLFSLVSPKDQLFLSLAASIVCLSSLISALMFIIFFLWSRSVVLFF